MVHVDLGKQHDVDSAQSLVIASGHRAAGIVENSQTPRILKDHSAVIAAKLAVVLA
jgi:hypothetical protein